MKKVINILATFLFVFPFILNALNAQEKKLQFSDKATHSVSLQYNIGVYPKNRFVYQSNSAN